MNYEQLSKLVIGLTTFVKNNPRVFATPQRLIDAKLVKEYKNGKILQNILRSKEQEKEDRIENVVLSIILFRYDKNTIFENLYGDRCPLYYILDIFRKQSKDPGIRNKSKDLDIRNKRYAFRRFLFEKL